MNSKEKLTEATMLALRGKANTEQNKKVVLKNQMIKLKENYSNQDDLCALIELLLQFVREELYNLFEV